MLYPATMVVPIWPVIELPAVVPVDQISSWNTMGRPTFQKSPRSLRSLLPRSEGFMESFFSFRNRNRHRIRSSTTRAMTVPTAAPRIPRYECKSNNHGKPVNSHVPL